MKFILEKGIIIIVQFVFILGITNTTTLAQSRVNTKDLSKKLKKVAEKQMAEAEDEAKNAKNNIDECDRKLEEIRKKGVELNIETKQIFGNMISKIIAHPKAAPILKKDPQSIRTIPQVKEALRLHPDLSPFLDELLKKHFKSD